MKMTPAGHVFSLLLLASLESFKKANKKVLVLTTHVMDTMLGQAWEYLKPSVELHCCVLFNDTVLAVDAGLDTSVISPSMPFFFSLFSFPFSSLQGNKNNEWLFNVA